MGTKEKETGASVLTIWSTKALAEVTYGFEDEVGQIDIKETGTRISVRFKHLFDDDKHCVGIGTKKGWGLPIGLLANLSDKYRAFLQVMLKTGGKSRLDVLFTLAEVIMIWDIDMLRRGMLPTEVETYPKPITVTPTRVGPSPYDAGAIRYERKKL